MQRYLIQEILINFMSGPQDPKKFPTKLLALPLLSILVAGLFLTVVIIPSPTVKADFGDPVDPDYYIKYVSLGVYSPDDIGTWDSENEGAVLKINPDNTLNIVEVCVKYDPNGIIDYETMERAIFITFSIDDGNGADEYDMDLYSNSLGRSEATFRLSGLDYGIDPGIDYAISITYEVVIK